MGSWFYMAAKKRCVELFLHNVVSPVTGESGDVVSLVTAARLW
jgi:hypothetical protein